MTNSDKKKQQAKSRTTIKVMFLYFNLYLSVMMNSFSFTMTTSLS